MKKCAALAIIPFLVACSSDEEDLIKQQQQQIQQLQSQLQTSGVQEVTPSLPAPAQYQQTQQYQQAPQYQQPVQQAPVVVQEHNDNGLLGGMAGFMLGHALGNNGNGSSSTHVERHYITNNTSTSNTSSNRIRDTPRLPTTIRNQPAPIAAPAPAKPSSSFWSSKPSISQSPSRPFSSKSSSSFSSRPSIRRK